MKVVHNEPETVLINVRYVICLFLMNDVFNLNGFSTEFGIFPFGAQGARHLRRADVTDGANGGDSGMKVRLFSVRAGVSPVALSSSAVLKLLRSMRTQ